jgi:DNA-binding MarR family transcriptional regulator
MSVQATSWAWNQSTTTTEKLVLLALADHAWPDGTHAYPSISRLARMTGLTERSVRRAISSLIEKDLIVREINAGGTPDYRIDRRPNLYTLPIERGDTVSARDIDGMTQCPARGDTDDRAGGHSVSQTIKEPHLNKTAISQWVSLGENFSHKPLETFQDLLFEKTTDADEIEAAWSGWQSRQPVPIAQPVMA